jgi:hypothetical protein
VSRKLDNAVEFKILLVHPYFKELFMDSTRWRWWFGRPAEAIGMALAAAGLMIVVAWFKRSAAAGSVTEEVLEVTVQALMVMALFIPYFALLIGGSKNGASQS